MDLDFLWPIGTLNKVMTLIKCREGLRDMKKYKREFLQTLAAGTRALILVFLLHGIVKVFWTLNSRGIVKSERQSFLFDFGGRTCFGFCSKEMWSLSFRTKLKTLYDQVHNLTIVFSITIGIRLFYNFSGWLLDVCIINKLLFLVLFTCSPLYCLTRKTIKHLNVEKYSC